MNEETAYLFSPGGYLYDSNGNIVRDQFGRPVMTEPSPDIPFALRSWQPFGTHQANNKFGLNAVESNFRFFCDPDERLTLNTELMLKNKKYKITWVFPYNSHFEVLVKFLP
ncbi:MULTISPECIES: hypothetical protein [Cytobacillus]|uniref:hypothetical protein n=1 Tax=Cytobacillus TaxID=2675230 RepID=UPI0020413E2A|nr:MULTISPECIES: hypothetical protein [Cytobacillus]MCM3394866.1 hypothetical protein [Cytobacillus oceanisediminis]UQX56054.1 hypothetical protein M5V91_10735 [Cytobacillus pseudoceanisediminis]